MTDASGGPLAARAPPLAGAHAAAAQVLLGADHPLVRAEHCTRWLGRQEATLSAAVAATDEHALDLIADGRGALPLSVRRRRAAPPPVSSPSSGRGDPGASPRGALSLPRASEEPHPLCPRLHPRSGRDSPPPFACSGAQTDAMTVGCVERLLGRASSPLYGDDPMRLREEIRRIHFGAADANHRASSVRERRPSFR